MLHSLDDIVKLANDRLAQEGLEAVNSRLVRHYTNTGALPKPVRNGKFAEYDDTYVENIVMLRKFKAIGVPSKMASYVTSSMPETSDELSLASETTVPTTNSSLAAHQKDALAALHQLSAVKSNSSPQAYLPMKSGMRTVTDNQLIVSASSALSAHVNSLKGPTFASMACAPATSNVTSTTKRVFECMPGVEIAIDLQRIPSWTPAHQQELETFVKTFKL